MVDRAGGRSSGGGGTGWDIAFACDSSEAQDVPRDLYSHTILKPLHSGCALSSRPRAAAVFRKQGYQLLAGYTIEP